MRRVIKVVFIIVVLSIPLLFFLPKEEKKDIKTYNFVGLTKEEVDKIGKQDNLNIIYEYEKSKSFAIDRIIRQEKKDNCYIVTISLGDTDLLYQELKVNELGNVPIMMYHATLNEKAKYIGGNIDENGYQRTLAAFKNDLEFYYQEGYRMIRLYDYINGRIDVPVGKSPIILTFDDGDESNIKVKGLDDKGNIIIDENSAVGILESMKEKYPDFQVTATFFINGSLFEQEEYNEKIILWLIENGYDIGNHSYSHADFSKIDKTTTVSEIGKQYELLSSYTSYYIPVVALPFGSPYAKTHPNFNSILNGRYNDINYITESTLRVGWDSELSPFHKDFDKTFLKRIRAYDNNGTDFDIAMTFKKLETTKYISDGNVDTITIPKNEEENIAAIDFSYQTYEIND